MASITAFNCVRLIDGHARIQPRDCLKEVLIAIAAERSIESCRDPVLRVVIGKCKIARHDPNDDERDSIEANRLSHGRPLAENSMRKAAAQHHHSRRARPVVRGGEHATLCSASAQHLEDAAGTEHTEHALGITAPSDDASRVRKRRHRLEAQRARLPVVIVAWGRTAQAVRVAAVPRHVAENDDPVGLSIRQFLQHHTIDDAENGAVRADCERHGGDADHREARGVTQHAHGTADVLNQ